MGGGWSWDDDVSDPHLKLEAENAVRQARRLVQLIRESVTEAARFELTPEIICELNALAVQGLTGRPGEFRVADVEILGSRHEPPPWAEVPQLVDEMCAETNAGGQEAVHLAAYVMWRLNWIHPFEEGNGRTARAAAYLVLSVALGQELPGDVTLIERLLWSKIRYYRALESADRAWQARQLNLTEMTAFLRELLEAQLANE